MRNKYLDLHGMTREDAFLVVEDKLLSLSNIGSFTLEIITGNSKPMQDGVKEICERYNFSYFIPSHNLGMISVTYSPL